MASNGDIPGKGEIHHDGYHHVAGGVPGVEGMQGQPQQLQLLAQLQQRGWETQLSAHMAAQQQQHMMQNSLLPPVGMPVPEEQYTLESLSNKKINDIKDILRAAGKRVTGNKEDLIARILGLEEPGNQLKSPSKKRKADQITNGIDNGDEEEEEEEADGPPMKKFKVDKNDPIYNACFLCQSKEDLVKYKDLRECMKCKLYWKGKRLTKQDAHAMFMLEAEDLQQLPHKEFNPDNSGNPINLYAFATAAGAAVKKFGALYYLVRDFPQERASLAVQILNERQFREAQQGHADQLHNDDALRQPHSHHDHHDTGDHHSNGEGLL